MTMCPWVFLNGSFLARDSARISPFDRGFLFSDAVYEVIAIRRGKPIDGPAHLDRLTRSMDGLHFADRPKRADLEAMQAELIARNRLDEGIIYLQISRGTFPIREFFPSSRAQPTVFAYADALNIPGLAAGEGIRIITTPDQRWRRRDLKTTSLLAQCLAKAEALDKGADDAWMIEDGFVTEGSASNAWIVTGDTIVTRECSTHILSGVTRARLLALAEGMKVVERAFTVEEACNAKEAFATAASKIILPVIEIDGHRIGQGRPGPVARHLQDLYLAAAENE